MKTYYFLFILLFAITIPALQAQNEDVRHSKADRYYTDLAYAKAIELYEEMALDNQADAHVIKRLAVSYRMIDDTENAEYWYSLLMDMPNREPDDIYFYAQMLKSNEKYEESEEWMEEYAKLRPNDSRAKHEIENQDNLDALLMGETSDIEVRLLSVNTKEADFGAIYWGNQMVFASARQDDKAVKRVYAWNGKPFLDLYTAKRGANGELVDPQEFSDVLNSRFHEGPTTFDKGGNVIYFTRNNYFKRKVGKSSEDVNNLKIYVAKRIGNTWGNIESLHFNSDEYSCGHATLSTDGKKMYFVSDMPGGVGGTDLYFCEKIGSRWGQPVNLGKGINTEGNEMFPYLHPDGTLFYSSDGFFGLGGLDIFKVVPLEDAEFDFPMNLGVPFNSPKDDFAFIADKKKQSGYFSSNRDGGMGDDDIYYFYIKDPEHSLLTNLPPETKGDKPMNENPPKTDDTDPNMPVADNNPDTPAVNNNPDTPPDTVRQVPQKPPRDWDKMTTDDLERGKIWLLENIYYDLDKWYIRPDAAIELDKVVAFMKNNPSVKIELSSHTDCRASDEYNMELSRKRAISAVMYIVLRGIDTQRIQAKGYGEHYLVNECEDGVDCSETQHQMNRRTEIKIVDF